MRILIVIIAVLLFVAGWIIGDWYPDRMLLGSLIGGLSGGIVVVLMLDGMGARRK